MKKIVNCIFWICLVSLSIKLIFIIGYWANIEKFLPPNGEFEMRYNEYSRQYVETENFIIADSNYVDEWGLASSHYGDWEFVRSKWLWLYELLSFAGLLIPIFFVRRQFNKVQKEAFVTDLILFRPVYISNVHLGVRRIFSVISNMRWSNSAGQYFCQI